jgi:uncharacterized protein (DUF2267 family)
MSRTGLEVFDRTVQITNTWLKEINDAIGPDRQLAWHVLGAVLRTLRDRLPIGLAGHLGAQLPLLVRGLYYDQWHPRKRPPRLRSAKQFMEEVAIGLGDTRPVNVAEAVRIVFQVLNHHVDPDQLANVRDALSQPVRSLWPDHKSESNGETPADRSLETAS